MTPEGSYRAFLVTYDFTQEELEAIHNGIPVSLNLEDKTIIEDIDLNSNDFFNRSAPRSCSTITIQSCITTQDCDQGGSTHTAGDACIANGNANDPSTVCVPVSIITSCGQNTNGDGTDNSGGGGGGGADSQADTDDAVEETVPCDSLPEGQGIEIGNGLCIVPDSGLTGPLISIDLNNNNQQDPEPRTIEEICEDIAEQITDPDFAEKADEINSNFNVEQEAGFEEKTDGSFEPMQPIDEHSVSFEPTASSKGYLHKHTNNREIPDDNGDGIPDEAITFKIFSPNDIVLFVRTLQQAHQAGTPIEDVYGSVYTSNRDYTLRFNGNPEDA